MQLVVWPLKVQMPLVFARWSYLQITVVPFGVAELDVMFCFVFTGLGCGTLAVLEQNEAGIVLLRR